MPNHTLPTQSSTAPFMANWLGCTTLGQGIAGRRQTSVPTPLGNSSSLPVSLCSLLLKRKSEPRPDLHSQWRRQRHYAAHGFPRLWRVAISPQLCLFLPLLWRGLGESGGAGAAFHGLDKTLYPAPHQLTRSPRVIAVKLGHSLQRKLSCSYVAVGTRKALGTV